LNCPGSPDFPAKLKHLLRLALTGDFLAVSGKCHCQLWEFPQWTFLTPLHIPSSPIPPPHSKIFLCICTFFLTYRPLFFTHMFCIRNAFPFSCRQALFDTLSAVPTGSPFGFFFISYIVCACLKCSSSTFLSR